MKKKLLSLFSGCGGMDIGFEGNFSIIQNTLNKDIHKDWIAQEKGKYITLAETIFETVFANDINKYAKIAWDNYFSSKRGESLNETFKVESIVNLVKRYRAGEKDIFPSDIDIVTGGFPCQAFSYAGKKLGLNDARGTLFYEFARVVKEVNPPICIGENVRGLLSHEKGKTLEGMISILDEIGYNVVPVRVLKAINYKVPQKRERLILVGVRKDIDIKYEYPKPHKKVYNLSDALKKGELYNRKVPKSDGAKYPNHKKEVLDLIPPKGYWRDLPIEMQKDYMGKSFYLGGGKTGMARRIGWDEPCLTLTCSPAQKQTERCHPDETRPFTVREYGRIQTFPDDWKFMGSISQQYKQIGNAVPCNLGQEIGYSIVKFLNDLSLERK